MIVGIQDEILKIQSLGLLNKLLFDKTTKRNILWATDAYKNLGTDFGRDKEIKVPLITGRNSFVIKNRARKALEQQTERVKQHGEVFTPFWVCKKMINCADKNWFSTPDVFFSCNAPTPKINFTSKRSWKHYVDSRRLEIACGEAPFLVSRYDVLTGEILPIENRTGMLDRKLRAVNENTADETEWLKWVMRAFQATYGYEFQGDNLLIARINLLMTFEEYLYKRWRRKPTEAEYRTITNIIAWNIWQMDGLTGKIPYCAAQNFLEVSLFDNLEPCFLQPQLNMQPPCRIYDWRRDNSLEFLNVNKGGRNMKFDFIIGNPPYQETIEGTSDKPIYNYFMDECYKICDKVELITPARFLFNAGKTPKAWNSKILKDPHFKVIDYAQESKTYFSNTDIKGGVAITYRDTTKNFGAMDIFIRFKEMNTVKNKVLAISSKFLNELVYAPESYRFTDKLHIDYPDIKFTNENKGLLSKGHDYDLTTNIFDKLETIIFFESKPKDNNEYIQIMGRKNNKRVYMYVKKDYVAEHENLMKWKVIFSKSTGTGTFGETLSEPMIAAPLVGHTQSFISIGAFDSKEESQNLIKYIKTKFARALLGIYKVTQDNKNFVWKCVPLQDFTANSDINWSKAIAEIDKQLYKKYGLDKQEIEFIETHVKEMA